MFTYYRYMDKFHCEPKDWKDLFEYLAYNEADTKINNVVATSKEVK